MTALSARHWQLAAFVVAILPQWERLPSWLVVGLVFACIWRLPSVEQRLGLPNALVRVLLLLSGMAGVYASHRSLVGPEGGVSFLIVASALKLLESRTSRDFFVLAVLDFFILATSFIFYQSLLLSLYVSLALVMVIAALLSQQQRSGVSARTTLWRAFVMTAQAVPLMIILFVFFPRLPPIWTLSLTQASGKTGMTDTMTPGDISTLSESAALAFRVEFQGEPPPQNSLYWRGLTLSRFDGKTWKQGVLADGPVMWSDGGGRGEPLAASEQQAIRYRVVLEPTDAAWLFALTVPWSPTPKVGMTRDYRLVNQLPVFSRMAYDVVSYPNLPMDAEKLSTLMYRENLHLPASGNQQSRALAQRWRSLTGSDERFIGHVLNWFRNEPFYYTLEPPPLGEQRVDDFLFRTRRGFCEYYASSFVFLMRAGGVPARVVVGYQGGEKSPVGDYWMVRQLDAHAWAEVWLEGRGWVTVDPTGAVAPDRIEKGVQQMAEDPQYWGDSGASAFRYGSYQLFRELRQLTDYFNYRWQRDVLGYDVESQEGLMQRLLGDASLLKRIGLMVAILAVLVAGLLLWTLYGNRRHVHPIDRIYLRYCRRLARLGVVREAGEGPQAFAGKVAMLRPAEAERAKEVATLYSALRYSPSSKEPDALVRRLRRLVRGA